MKHILTLLTLIATPAFAEGIRDTDVQLDLAGMDMLLTGKVITFFDGSRSSYAPDGAYGYSYTDGGPVWRGRYTLHDDSRVCVVYQNGDARCDTFVLDGDRAVLITRDGTRFPVRNLTVYQR